MNKVLEDDKIDKFEIELLKKTVKSKILQGFLDENSKKKILKTIK